MPVSTEDLQAKMFDEVWLNHLHEVFTKMDGKLQETPGTYSGFLSHGQSADDVRPRATVGVFPVFYEKASSMAMQKRSMLVVKKAREFMNPGQVPVIVGDCPLYAKQKICQWEYPDEIGELKIVCFILKTQVGRIHPSKEFENLSRRSILE